MTDYTYSASGAKLSVTYTNGVTTTNNQYCGNMLYEQIREPSPDLKKKEFKGAPNSVNKLLEDDEVRRAVKKVKNI